MAEQTSLAAQRAAASAASAGASSDVIHASVMKLLEFTPREARILDYGSGRGALLHALSTRGFGPNLTGADLYERPTDLPPGVAWVRSDLNDPLPLPAGSFDLVISTEVIEHLENPRATFREWSRLLSPNGRVIATTPNQESIRSYAALLLRGHFVAFADSCYPAHITALLRKDLERLCAEVGFTPPEFSYTNSGGVPGKPHLSWQHLSVGLLAGRLFSDNVVLTTTRLARSP